MVVSGCHGSDGDDDGGGGDGGVRWRCKAPESVVLMSVLYSLN